MSSHLDDQELRDLLAEEVTDACDVIEAAVLALEGGDRSGVDAALRAAHSTKGAAATLGVGEVAGVAHELETLLAELRDGRREGAASVIAAMLAAVDAFRGSREGILRGRVERSALVEAAVTLRGHTGSTAGGPSSVPPVTAPEAGRVSAEATPASADPPLAAAESPTGTGGEGNVRVSATRLQRLLTASGQLVSVRQQVTELSRELRSVRSVTEEGLAGRRGPDRGASAVADPLEDVATRLVRLDEQARRIERQTIHVAADVEETALATALLSFADTAAGMPRVVRDTAAAQGVEVRLEVAGEQVQADRRVVAALRAPLVHLIRNAVVHGIELPEARRRSGKPVPGTVRLDVAHDGGDVVVEVADDGRGIDVEAVRDAAAVAGLVRDQTVSDDTELLFLPGLSTAAALTEHAGRGIGMDIVRRGVEGIGGQVTVSTTPGGGTRVTLRAPVTLATMRVLLADVGEETVAVLAHPVERVVRLVADDLVTVGDRLAVRHGTHPVPLVDLGALFTAGPRGSDGDRALIVEAGDGHLALRVDHVHADRDVLVTPFGPRLADAGALLGTTVLPDGRRVVVLHPLAAARRVGDRAVVPAPVDVVDERRRRILVVEDTPTTRALERSVLEAAGYEVVATADGGEALAYLAEHEVDLVVTDVDMPRVDGIELCEALRRSPRWHGLPVVLVTSLDAEEDRRRGMEAGADAYVLKSDFDSGRFLRTVAGLL